MCLQRILQGLGAGVYGKGNWLQSWDSVYTRQLVVISDLQFLRDIGRIANSVLKATLELSETNNHFQMTLGVIYM